jgi:hypothetical protein
MGWTDDVTALWSASGTSYPLAFVLGWISVEQPNNAAPPTSLGELGWFQIHPDEARMLGIDLARVPTDEAYSFTSGLAVLDYYAARLDPRFVGEAHLGMLKLSHTLPAGAAYVTANYSGDPSSWASISSWIRANAAPMGAWIATHSTPPWHGSVPGLAANVDKVMGAAASSPGLDLHLDLAPLWGDLFGDDEAEGVPSGDELGLVVVGVLLLAVMMGALA